jgi:ribosomal-protein-alanine N-acetyltransferase
MQIHHIPAVAAIERLSFITTWPASAYRREIERNHMAYYAVAKRTAAADPPRRERQFPVVGADTSLEGEGLLARVVRHLRGDAPPVSPEDAEELEAIVGYSGMWLTVGTAHVTTIAVDPLYRGEGIGELLLVALVEHAMELRAAEMTLEVRVSNYVAQSLYRKYTFRRTGLRKRYYSDDGEDALIMTAEAVQSATFQMVLAENRRRLEKRMLADA